MLLLTQQTIRCLRYLLMLGIMVVGVFLRAGISDNTLCVAQNGSMVGCSPAHQMCPDPPTSGPSFHLTPRCHEGGGGNDPCAPIWDPNHEMYHIFFQDHLAAPSPTTAAHHGGGPIWGHWLSKDLVRWSRAPVALWNGLDASAVPPRVTPYDNGAIYTGSATLVNGSIKLVYPGLCGTNATGKDCPLSTGHGRGCHLGVAVPASTDDPLLTNWSKAAFNPFATNTGRDPSAAWLTPSGEWQFTTYMGDLFGTMDWNQFYQITSKVSGWGGECPSLFPLPRSTPGSCAASRSRYSHVYKVSKGNRDWMILGRYTAAALPNTSGTWQALKTPQMVDSGGLYASKDWIDATGRRLTTGFGHCPGSAGGMTLPREVTFHPALDALVFQPISEIARLRERIEVNMSNTTVAPDEPLHVVSSNQTEVMVEFALPTEAMFFGINVSGGLLFFVNFTLHEGTSAYHEVVVGANIGSDHAAPAPPLRLLPTDRSIRMQLFVDDAFVECYFQDGRQVITWGKMGKKPEDDGVAITAFASKPLELRRAVAFKMGAIWSPVAVHVARDKKMDDSLIKKGRVAADAKVTSRDTDTAKPVSVARHKRVTVWWKPESPVCGPCLHDLPNVSMLRAQASTMSHHGVTDVILYCQFYLNFLSDVLVNDSHPGGGYNQLCSTAASIANAYGLSVQLLLQNDESSHATRNSSIVLAALRRPDAIAAQLLHISDTMNASTAGWNFDFEPWPHSHDPAHGPLYAHFLGRVSEILSGYGYPTVSVCANNWTSLFTNYSALSLVVDTVFDMSTYHAGSQVEFARTLHRSTQQFAPQRLPKLATALALYTRFDYEKLPDSVGERFAVITQANVSHVALFAFPMSHGVDPWGSNVIRQAWWNAVANFTGKNDISRT
eukprot:SAG31_NODE_2395_length_5790_cov_73.555614_5_plen_891_part_00